MMPIAVKKAETAMMIVQRGMSILLRHVSVRRTMFAVDAGSWSGATFEASRWSEGR